MAKKTILIIEDEAPKRKHIEDYVVSHNRGDKFRIVCRQSVSSALDFLDDSKTDFIILDMSLPTFEISDTENGGRPQGFGGLEVLRHLKMSGISTPTLVLTGYEAFMREEGLVELSQLSDELKREFGMFLKDVLYYNSAYSEWKNKISVTLKTVGIY